MSLVHRFVQKDDVQEIHLPRNSRSDEPVGTAGGSGLEGGRPISEPTKATKGLHHIFLDMGPVARLSGAPAILTSLEKETGAGPGINSQDGRFSVATLPGMGLGDQAPAALVDGVPFTYLTPARIRRLIRALKEGNPAQTLAEPVQEPVYRVRQLRYPCLTNGYEPGVILGCLTGKGPMDILMEIRNAGLRGTDGDFQATAAKWAAARVTEGPKTMVVYADGGRQGMFKDRFLLDRYPGLVLEGLMIAMVAVDASEGQVILPFEYDWLKPGLRQAFRAIRGALRVSGIRGIPDMKVSIGSEPEPYHRSAHPDRATGDGVLVHHVETLALVSRICQHGAEAFRRQGTPSSPGTKLLCLSGDVDRPGIYEIPWGMALRGVLEVAGARNPARVWVNHARGEWVEPSGFDRILGWEDLPTDGNLMVVSGDRTDEEVDETFRSNDRS